MEFDRKSQSTADLVRAWEAGSLSRNPEYQRGAAWSMPQKQALIDSLFRKYPIPAIFLERKQDVGLFGSQAEHYEIIDGQQRILAMTAFYRDEFELLRPDDDKLRLPHSLRAINTPWSGRRYSQLDQAMKTWFESAELDVYLVQKVENPDEVRDLFIRLQSGTALTRQQIRDAWPGNIGPLIETYAGKLARQPKFRLFSAVDGRGTRDDEDDPRDTYVKHRQSCSQLMRVLVARMSDPMHFPSVRADDIDAFYHEQTNINPNGPMIGQIEEILSRAQQVTDFLQQRWQGRRKISKLSLFALALFFQDMATNPWYRFDASSANRLAEYIADVPIPATGRTVSGRAIEDYYSAWKSQLPEGIGIQLDEKRVFDNNERQLIFARQSGRCAICDMPVSSDDAEYDHYPLPHFLGGRTLPDNGRLVHKRLPSTRPSKHITKPGMNL